MTYRTGMTADSAEIAALAIDGPQPVWMTLNEAREHAFTGELVFEADPEVYAYLDNGIVYYAERASDESLGRRLLEAGMLDMIQLERGTVRVGDIEHLGRLFDRDSSIDRDAVVVFSEVATEDLITDLANRTTTTVRVTAYRHHPSGLHRWFVAPREPAAMTRPLSAVAQLDTTVVDQLPGLPFGSDMEELTIEWDDPTERPNDTVSADNDDTSLLDEFEAHGARDDVAEPDTGSFELIEFSDDVDSATIAIVDIEIVHVEILDVGVVDDVKVVNDSGDLGDFDFSVVWPDGSEQLATESWTFVEDEDSVEHEGRVDDVNNWDADGVTPVFTQADDGEFQFVMPPLMLSDDPDLADSDVPDDVADAVRRAIAAIETANVPATQIRESTDGDPIGEDTAQLPAVDVEMVSDDGETDHAETVESIGSSALEDDSADFAPPTMATRAEVLYGQMTDSGSFVDNGLGPYLPDATSARPSDGDAVSVVSVEDQADEESDGNDRSSALRRLIGGLRRNDH